MALGMTGAEMANNVAGAISYDTSNSTHLSRIYRWLNMSQLWMYGQKKLDWPELRVSDASFTTDGSTSYDLTSAIDSAVGRVIDRSVRIGNRMMYPMPKSFTDETDPSRATNGSPIYYQQLSRKDFRLYPYGSNGDTVYLDYIKYPTEITANTTAANVSFTEERHELIELGAIWRGLRFQGITKEWMEMRNQWIEDVTQNYSSGRVGTIYPRRIVPHW